jgi:hypothetical protein
MSEVLNSIAYLLVLQVLLHEGTELITLLDDRRLGREDRKRRAELLDLLSRHASIVLLRYRRLFSTTTTCLARALRLLKL